jgi:protein-disulfide isomerase
MSTTSDQNVTLNLQPLLMPVAIVISSMFLSIAIAVAGISIGNGLSGTSFGKVAGANTATNTTSSAGTGDAAVVTATANIDDDPVLGNADAKVAIIEFSDYECPFCKQFRDQTMDQIKTNFIDNGKAKLVFRDLPLSFHEPAASYAANLMECIDEAGGDAAYYAMHDWWFANTATNGKGVSDKSKVTKAVNALGLNGADVSKCANDAKFAEEIKKDTADAAAININGTPGFLVGNVDGQGNVTGEIISGAYPYAEFERVISKYL